MSSADKATGRLSLSLCDIEPLLRETIAHGTSFPMTTHGTSMLPLIRDGVDTVFLAALPDVLTPGDILLYKRPDGQYVLHRLMGVCGDECLFCGDHQQLFERGIKKDALIARAVALQKNDAPEETVDFLTDPSYLAYQKALLKEKWHKHRMQTFRRLVHDFFRFLHIK